MDNLGDNNLRYKSILLAQGLNMKSVVKWLKMFDYTTNLSNPYISNYSDVHVHVFIDDTVYHEYLK